MQEEIKQAKAAPVITSLEAQLFVADMQASFHFYTEKLGFAVAFFYGEPPFYGQVMRDSARLNLRQMDEPVFTDVRKREALLCASLTVATASEIKQLFLQYQGAGVLFHQSLQQEPWGAWTFVVSDPDDNLLLFAGPAN